MAKFRRFQGAFSWFFIELETHAVERDICLIATAQRHNCSCNKGSYNKGYIAYLLRMRETAIFPLAIWGRFQLIFSSEKQICAIFILSVYLAYWPRKRATCWATHVDHFRQSPSYNVVGADTLRDLVTLTFDLLTLDSGQTWQVMRATPPPSLKILRISVLDLWVMMSAIDHR